MRGCYNKLFEPMLDDLRRRKIRNYPPEALYKKKFSEKFGKFLRKHPQWGPVFLEKV